MSRLTLLAVMAAALGSGPAMAAGAPGPGHYRVSEGPDVAGALIIGTDHRFKYMLAAGALDEHAQGSWYREGSRVCLRTEPRPVPPVFSIAAEPQSAQESTLMVTWPDGQGIALVDFRIGFELGEPQQGYTQTYGWSMPEDDNRVPRWIELSVPMYRIKSPRFALSGLNKVHAILTPNDLGVVDFQGACLEKRGDAYVLHREEGDMRLLKGR
ncbi:MAG: hypothetical protein AB7F98_18015 [Novosphingobium sp.]